MAFVNENAVYAKLLKGNNSIFTALVVELFELNLNAFL